MFSYFNRLSETYPSLKIRDFRYLWLGQIISQIGDACYFLIFMFMVDKITGSPEKVAITQFVEWFPFFLFAPLAGVVADRYDRKKIMLFCDIASFIILFILGTVALIVSVFPEWIIYVSAFGLSTINVHFSPAKSAALPQIVPKKNLLEANSLSSSTESFIPIVGTCLALIIFIPIYKVFPDYFFGGAIIFNSFTFLGSAFYIAKLPSLSLEYNTTKVSLKSSLIELYDGFKYVMNNKIIRMVLFLKVGGYVFASPFNTAYITVNSRWFGGGLNTLVYIEGAFSIAMVVASLLVSKSRISSLFKPYAISMFFVGFSIIGMAYSFQLPWFILFNILCGLALPYSNIPMTTYIQANVPENYLGRVNSFMLMLTQGLMAFVVLIFGAMFEVIGLSNIFLLMGVGQCVCAVVGYWSPAFRKADLSVNDSNGNKSVIYKC